MAGHLILLLSWQLLSFFLLWVAFPFRPLIILLAVASRTDSSFPLTFLFSGSQTRYFLRESYPRTPWVSVCVNLRALTDLAALVPRRTGRNRSLLAQLDERRTLSTSRSQLSGLARENQLESSIWMLSSTVPSSFRSWFRSPSSNASRSPRPFASQPPCFHTHK